MQRRWKILLASGGLVLAGGAGALSAQGGAPPPQTEPTIRITGPGAGERGSAATRIKPDGRPADSRTDGLKPGDVVAQLQVGPTGGCLTDGLGVDIQQGLSGDPAKSGEPAGPGKQSHVRLAIDDRCRVVVEQVDPNAVAPPDPSLSDGRTVQAVPR
jgi:hypothetical protein